MNKEQNRLGLWLFLTVAALVLSLSGCEQILGKDTSGEFGGTELIVDAATWTVSPSMNGVGDGVILTWEASPKVTYYSVYRREASMSRDDAYRIANIWKDNSGEERPLTGTIQYIDYFTNREKSYVYYVYGAYLDSSTKKWIDFESSDTASIQGRARDTLLVQGEVTVSYDQENGILSLTPALPIIPSKPAAGTGKTLLSFWDGDIEDNYTFSTERSSFDLTEIAFVNGFNRDISLALNYEPVYEKIDNFFTITYINADVSLIAGEGTTSLDEDGWITGIYIPQKVVPVPGIPDVEITSATSGTIILAWDSVPNAVTYSIYRNGVYLTQTTDSSYTDMGLTPDTDYTYQVSAVNAGGESELSEEKEAHTASNTQDLSAGQNITNTLSSGETHYYRFSTEAGFIYDIFWEDADSDSQNYTADIQVGVKANRDSSIYEVSLTNEGNSLSVSRNMGERFIVVKGVTAASSGRYTIGYSSYQETQSPPAAPDNFEVTGTTANAIGLSWDAVSDASYYKIYRNYQYLYQTSETSYTDTGLSPNTTYTYEVSAVNSIGEGNKTSSVQGITTSSSSEITYTPLSTSTTYYQLNPGDVHYYQFYALGNSTYYVNWIDRDTVSSYGDIKVAVKIKGVSDYLVPLTDDATLAPLYSSSRNKIPVTPASSGYIVVEIQGYSSYSSGSYGISYSYY